MGNWQLSSQSGILAGVVAPSQYLKYGFVFKTVQREKLVFHVRRASFFEFGLLVTSGGF